MAKSLSSHAHVPLPQDYLSVPVACGLPPKQVIQKNKADCNALCKLATCFSSMDYFNLPVTITDSVGERTAKGVNTGGHLGGWLPQSSLKEQKAVAGDRKRGEKERGDGREASTSIPQSESRNNVPSSPPQTSQVPVTLVRPKQVLLLRQGLQMSHEKPG